MPKREKSGSRQGNEKQKERGENQRQYEKVRKIGEEAGSEE